MKSIKRHFDWRVRNAIYNLIRSRNRYLKTHQSSKNIIVLGSGRSGTTWLGEVLSKIANVALLDEPLKLSSSHLVEELGLTGWGQYVPVGYDDWIGLDSFFDNLLTGTWFNPNHVQNQSINLIWNSPFFVIKFIRGNLLLPWLIDKYDLRKPVYIIRNPLSVVSSQLRHPGWGLNKDIKLNAVKSIPKFRFYDRFYSRYNRAFEKAKYIDEILTLLWKMENEYVITHPDHNKKWVEIKYENLIMNTEQEVRFICDNIELDYRDVGQQVLNKSSISTMDSISNLAFDQKWREQLGKDQIERIYLILRDSPLIEYLPRIS